MMLYLYLITYFIFSCLFFGAACYFSHKQESPVKTVKKTVLGTIFVFVGVAAAACYWHWGNSRGVLAYQHEVSNAAAINEFEKENKTPQDIIKHLQAVLKDHPNSAEGWYLLGRLYTHINDYGQAQIAMQKAYSLDNHSVNIQIELAQINYFAAAKNMTPATKQLIQGVLAQDADNEAMLNLLAIDAYDHQRFAEAARYWQQILKQHDPQSDVGQALLEAIAKAQKQAN